MFFILKSEVETIDIQKNYYKKRIYCPSCRKTQLKKLNSNHFYNKYKCWNKDCKEKETPFVVINDYIKNEASFEDTCDACEERYFREFAIDSNENFLLYFKCNGMLCETNIEPYCYNVKSGDWGEDSPKFISYEEQTNTANTKLKHGSKVGSQIQEIEEQNKDPIGSISEEFLEQKPYNYAYKIEEIPLLSMNHLEYSNFLEHHEDKVVVLVDMPNFVRTLRGLYRHNFESVLKKAHQQLLDFIEKSYHTSDDYIIRYFSKPDKDLEVPNKIIINFCTERQNKEYFHLLKMLKGGGYSDIDNYLIANGVEILERCTIKGFVIVSSDKDYLPVMRIASYKNIKSRILGINTSEIYEKYDIPNIKFLGIMNFFEKI
ncbi:MAG: NYN domain-containing protein [Promethearchaeota archaeon]|jgi:hypothetical protein